MHMVLIQMSNLISIHNSKTVLPGVSSTQRQNAAIFYLFVFVLLLKGEQLEQFIAQTNKLCCFIYLVLSTETNKFSVFLLREMNNTSSFAAEKRTTCTFFKRETSNLSSLKAVKPTTLANPNPDQLAHFSSKTNNLSGLEAVKTVIPQAIKYTKCCCVCLSFIS